VRSPTWCARNALQEFASRPPPVKVECVTKLPAALLFLGLTTAPAIAFAGPNDNSSSRPWTLDIGLGPMIHLEGGTAFGKAGLDFHYHFKGGDVGPALGAQFYMHFRERVFGFNVGPLFLWDFRVYQGGNFKLYLAPLIAAGYSFTSFNAGPVHGASHAFFADFGGQLKGVWNDRVGFFIRPINFSVWAGEGGATGFWTLIAGLTLSF
jgi:hypothetical protein